MILPLRWYWKIVNETVVFIVHQYYYSICAWSKQTSLYPSLEVSHIILHLLSVWSKQGRLRIYFFELCNYRWIEKVRLCILLFDQRWILGHLKIDINKQYTLCMIQTNIIICLIGLFISYDRNESNHTLIIWIIL
jgi:hypothetical protein